eukprot:1119483-Pleurochrysis_carterae.AAC.1
MKWHELKHACSLLRRNGRRAAMRTSSLQRIPSSSSPLSTSSRHSLIEPPRSAPSARPRTASDGLHCHTPGHRHHVVAAGRARRRRVRRVPQIMSSVLTGRPSHLAHVHTDITDSAAIERSAARLWTSRTSAAHAARNGSQASALLLAPMVPWTSRATRRS